MTPATSAATAATTRPIGFADKAALSTHCTAAHAFVATAATFVTTFHTAVAAAATLTPTLYAATAPTTTPRATPRIFAVVACCRNQPTVAATAGTTVPTRKLPSDCSAGSSTPRAIPAAAARAPVSC